MKFWNKMKKNSKGFTLVEIIVVLVILAVLAAFTIPTMLGFVNESKGKAMIAEAREVYVAAQATATEYEAKGVTVAVSELGSNAVSAAKAKTSTDAQVGEDSSLTMKNYLATDVDISSSATEPTTKSDQAYWVVTYAKDSSDNDIPGKIGTIVYTRNGYRVTITAGGGSEVEKIA